VQLLSVSLTVCVSFSNTIILDMKQNLNLDCYKGYDALKQLHYV
jgi:hypothetical protein